MLMGTRKREGPMQTAKADADIRLSGLFATILRKLKRTLKVARFREGRDSIALMISESDVEFSRRPWNEVGIRPNKLRLEWL